MTSYKMAKMNGLAHTVRAADLNRQAVCRRCGVAMSDIEPDYGYGSFMHPARICRNSGKFFSLSPENAKEIAPFERKRVRRAAKRAGVSV